MSARGMNPKVDAFLRRAKAWREELGLLRGILLDCGLAEELKWGKPCYAFEGSNVVVLLPLKNYCTALFCKGALLKDAKGFLVKAGENTQAARQWRFTSAGEIRERAAVLRAYLREAIAAEKAGLEVTYKKITEFKAPEELQRKLDGSAALATAFRGLTPGRQRAYYIFISGAKQAVTREARVEKCRERILAGKGLND